jgi:hypothetical protein
MFFRQTDGTSVVSHLRALPDGYGCGWLQEVGTLCGWGPATEWDDGFMADKGTVNTLLDVALARDTPAFFNVLIRLAPPVKYAQEWTRALIGCRRHYERLESDGDGFFVPERELTANEVAWESFSAWAVPRVAAIQKQLLPASLKKDQWAEQVMLAALATQEAVTTRKTNWRNHWDALKNLAQVMNVEWPGPHEDWIATGPQASWLPLHEHVWDAIALALDNPFILEESWAHGCGHETVANFTPHVFLSVTNERELGHLLGKALRPGQLGSPKVAQWLIEQTPMLEVTAVHPSVPVDPAKLWRDVLPLP